MLRKEQKKRKHTTLDEQDWWTQITLVNDSYIFSSPSTGKNVIYICTDRWIVITWLRRHLPQNPLEKIALGDVFCWGPSCEFTWTYESPTLGTRPNAIRSKMSLQDWRCLFFFSFLFFFVTVSFTWHEHNKLRNENLPSQQTAQQDVWCFVTPFVVMIKLQSQASAGVPIEIQEIYVCDSLHMV